MNNFECGVRPMPISNDQSSQSGAFSPTTASQSCWASVSCYPRVRLVAKEPGSLPFDHSAGEISTRMAMTSEPVFKTKCGMGLRSLAFVV